jgi:hypothetical protein
MLFERAILKIKRPQTYFLNLSGIEIDNEGTREISMTDLTKAIRNCRKK